MEYNDSVTLYQVAINTDGTMLFSREDKTMVCCCISKKWLFEHSGFPGIKNYDKNKNNCCICLDCCTWCLEFRLSKQFNCIKDTNCYLCCCSIYFT